MVPHVPIYQVFVTLAAPPVTHHFTGAGGVFFTAASPEGLSPVQILVGMDAGAGTKPTPTPSLVAMANVA